MRQLFTEYCQKMRREVFQKNAAPIRSLILQSILCFLKSLRADHPFSLILSSYARRNEIIKESLTKIHEGVTHRQAHPYSYLINFRAFEYQIQKIDCFLLIYAMCIPNEDMLGCLKSFFCFIIIDAGHFFCIILSNDPSYDPFFVPIEENLF